MANLKLLYQKKTAYNNVRVVEKDSIRTIKFGSELFDMSCDQSATDLYNPNRHVFDYSLLFMYNLCFNPFPNNVLIVGLGGGTIAKEIKHYFPAVSIDIIEIDPEILEIAKQYFFFREDFTAKVIIGDAFDVIDKYKNKYDFIMIDAFTNDYVPPKIASKAFLRKVKLALKTNGVASFNTCNRHRSFHSHAADVCEVFSGNVYFSIGPRNPLTTLLYAVNGNGGPSHFINLPKEYYPDIKVQEYLFDSV